MVRNTDYKAQDIRLVMQKSN